MKLLYRIGAIAALTFLVGCGENAQLGGEKPSNLSAGNNEPKEAVTGVGTTPATPPQTAPPAPSTQSQPNSPSLPVSAGAGVTNPPPAGFSTNVDSLEKK